MTNDWYRLNLEVALTAYRYHGIESEIYHDGFAQQIERNRVLATHNNIIFRILQLLKRKLNHVAPK